MKPALSGGSYFNQGGIFIDNHTSVWYIKFTGKIQKVLETGTCIHNYMVVYS